MPVTLNPEISGYQGERSGNLTFSVDRFLGERPHLDILSLAAQRDAVVARLALRQSHSHQVRIWAAEGFDLGRQRERR